jgi:hypothetical protein
MTKGFVILTNYPLTASEKFPGCELLAFSRHCYALFVPHAQAELGLSTMQKAVGGHIESFYHEGKVDCFCNEEGMLQQLPLLNAVVGMHQPAGDVLLCGIVHKTGDSVALEAHEYLDALKINKFTPEITIGEVPKVRALLDNDVPMSMQVQVALAAYCSQVTKQLSDVYARL